ncbi:MAG: LPXTG cell wall anchor domain-containing protein [Sphingomicrobium sp.]
MTALAAVMALSSAPLVAQTVDEPIVTTPTPTVETTPAPAAADPVAAAPVAETPVAADPLAAKTTKVTTRKATTKATSVKTTAARARPAATHASTAAPAVATAPAAAISAPVAEVPVEQPLPRPTEIAAEPAPQPPATTAISTNDMLPVAGGLGILLLAGTGLVVRRRRRRAQEADDAAWQADIETAAEPPAEPAMTVEPEPALQLIEPAPVLAPAFIASAPEPVPAAEATPAVDGPVTELPEGFDLSRFGYNVQAAYKGPTEDNPSLSLKHRLRRASGMDQQERKLDAEVEAATGEPVLAESDLKPPTEAPAAKPAVIRHVDGDFILGRASKKPSLSPALSK